MSTDISLRNILFLLCGIIYFIVAILLILTGFYEVLGLLSTIIAPLSSFLVGFFGMKILGPELYAREDRYQMMGVMLSMSLLMFTLVEISASLLSNLPQSDSFLFMVGLLLLASFFPLSLGVFRYLDSTNTALNIANRRRLWTFVFIIAIIGTATLYLLAFDQIFLGSVVDIIAITPIILMGLSVIASVAILSWVFRHGKLYRPFTISLFALILLLARVVAWCCLDLSPYDPLSQALAAVSYFIFGGTLESARLL
jgi:hypothetical protein